MRALPQQNTGGPDLERVSKALAGWILDWLRTRWSMGVVEFHKYQLVEFVQANTRPPADGESVGRVLRNLRHPLGEIHYEILSRSKSLYKLTRAYPEPDVLKRQEPPL